MDTSFMNFHGVEHFSLDSCFSENSGIECHNLDDTSTSDFSLNPISWAWENEREINGDLALVPTTSIGPDFCELSTSPTKEDINKMFTDWQQFINADTPAEDIPIDFPTLEDKIDLYEQTLLDNDDINEKNFDITKYIHPEPTKPPGPGGKKIDMIAQKYVVAKLETNDKDEEEDHVDVETISEQPSPVLEAGDVDSLLEQFEAETKFNIMKTEPKCSLYDEVANSNSSTSLNVKTEPEKVVKSKPNTATPQTQTKLEADRHKLIIDALPQELINRIKQCSKRKVISVIPAKPTRKRGRPANSSRSDEKTIQVADDTKSQQNNELLERIKISEDSLFFNRNNVRIDHDYCVKTAPVDSKQCSSKKDSGFESAEEEDKCSMKGKTMVSILKSNNLRSNACTASNIVQRKRKLNLEEYKKRREFSFKSSASNSPVSSGRTSPIVVEDEHTKRVKHQELMMKMASEILKPVKKTDTKISLPALPIITYADEKPAEIKEKPEDLPPSIEVKKETKPMPNFEMKTLVSVATNTDESWSELKEIKPILDNINLKISPNSLIAAVIENIPKVKTKQHVDKLIVAAEHGEDKTIVFLDKNRPQVTTCDAHVQTDSYGNEVAEFGRSRRRNSSSSYSRSSSSSSSSSSLSSSTSSSLERSRSPSPMPCGKVKYKRRKKSPDFDKMCEVEERRVVYVGGISCDTTRDDLKKRFQVFGPISNVSVHFRAYGDNYGFVTFLHKLDAYEAVERGNYDPNLPRYDLSFGGRRIFCKTNYSDLDDVRDDCNYFSPKRKEDSFDNLLREVQAKLRRRKI